MSGRGLEDVYDEATLRAIDGWSPGEATVEPVAPWRAVAIAGGLTAALVGGVREAFEDVEEALEEVELAPRTSRLEPVTLYFVPGEPRASVAIVRPWLL